MHFKEARELVQGGLLGKITHVVMQFPGGLHRAARAARRHRRPTSTGRCSRGRRPRHAYQASRQRRWRSYYDYGGGLVTDWGVHLVDVAHWYLKLDAKAPKLTSASAQYVNVQNPEHDQVPDAFIVSWQYDNVVMSFTNAVPPDHQDFGAEGT